MKKAVIFDFDGTLADTAGILHEIYNELAQKKKWQKLNDKDYRKLFTATVWHAIKWSKFRPWRLLYLVRYSREQLHTEVGRISLFKGIPLLIDQLHKARWDLYILSVNISPTIESVLKKPEITGKVTLLEKAVFMHKELSVKQLLKQKGYDPNNVWMVGDETRDIVAAKKAAVQSIGVTWGFQSTTVLKRAGPTHIAHKPSDIAKFLIPG